MVSSDRGQVMIFKSICAAGFAAALSCSASHAATYNEIGDAGQTAATSQSAVGFDTISGTLIDLGVGVADIDFYQIVISDVNAFAVSVTSSLSSDDDSEMFLFNSLFQLVLQDDDGASPRPRFAAGQLASTGSTAGTYYIALTLFSAIGLMAAQLKWTRFLSKLDRTHFN